METRICKLCGLEKGIDEYYCHTKNKCKECLKKKSREYKKEHHDEVLRKKRDYEERTHATQKYRTANYEKEFMRHKEYVSEHKEQYKAYRQNYYLKHTDKIRTYRKKYHEQNKDKVKSYRLKNIDKIRSYNIKYKNSINYAAYLIGHRTGIKPYLLLESPEILKIKLIQIKLLRLTKPLKYEKCD
jgi:hypothetical protein